MTPVSTKTKLIPVSKVERNPWNPNRMPDDLMAALVENIRRHGILQSVTVREVETPGEGGETVPGTGRYEIVDGEHRLDAAVLAEHTEVWGTITEMSANEAKAQTTAMNVLRGEMDPAGLARIWKDLADAGVPFADIAPWTGYSVEQMQAGVKMLDFEWPEPPSAPSDPDEQWSTLTIRMPEVVYVIVRAELERLKQATGTEHDFRALEAMAVASAQTPLESLA